MKVGKYFTLDEFTVSQSAIRHNLFNHPTESDVARIKALCEHILDPLREKLGKPVNINSGFRSPEVNKLVGGAKTSQHTKGEAADIVIHGMSISEVLNVIRTMKLPFDQLIDEFGAWTHVSYTSEGERGEVLLARKIGKNTVYTRVG